MNPVRSERPDMPRTEPSPSRRRLLQGLPVTERTVQLDGVSTALWEGGEGPPLILLHGQGGSAAAWIPVIPRLAAARRLIIPDLPGLGESVINRGEIDAERATAWLRALIAQTCDEPPTLAGISLGGTFAAHFAVRRGRACRQVVLIDSGSLAPFRPDPRVLPALIRLAVRPSDRNVERLFRHTVVDLDRFKALMGRKWPDFLAYGRERAATPSVQAANRQLLRRLGARQIPEPDLRRIEAPMALIWGRHDRVMKLRIAEAASARFGWPLQVLEDSGHACCWDQPDAFADALHAAIAGSAPTSALADRARPESGL